jgi:hypothetical protein
LETRDMSATLGSTTQFGGKAIGTAVDLTNALTEPVDPLRRLGVTEIFGASGNVQLPAGGKEIVAETPSEGSPATPQTETLTGPTVTSTRYVACADITDQLIIQSPPIIDQLVRPILLARLRAQVIRDAFTAVLSTTGIGAVLSHGAAPSYDDIVALEAEIIDDSAGARTGWATTPLVRKKLRTTMRVGGTDSPIWLPNESGRLLGDLADCTSLLSDSLSDGSYSSLSPIIRGNWSQLVIVWFGPGLGLELLTDRTRGAQGKRLAMVSAFAGAAVRTPSAFAVYKSDCS